MSTIDTIDKITRMDRHAVSILVREAEEELERVAVRHGLLLRKEKGTYSSEEFTTKFTFICETSDGIPADFARLAPLYGMKPDDWNKVVDLTTGKYRIHSIKPANRKYPIIARDVSKGTRGSYKFKEETITRALRMQYDHELPDGTEVTVSEYKPRG